MSPSVIGILVITAITLVSLIAIVGGFIHARRERLLTHAERMRALELGQSVPDDPTTAHIKAAASAAGELSGEESLPRKCYNTALWVAFWGFAFAASHSASGINSGVAVAIGSSTAVICTSFVICGTVLARKALEHPVTHQSVVGMPKVYGDPDAYDVVSRRG